MRENNARFPPPGYDASRPWNHVIGESAYGTQDRDMSAWWQNRFVVPVLVTNAPGPAAALIGALEGGAAHGNQLALRGVGPSADSGSAAPRGDTSRTPRRPALEDAPEASGGECFDYNLCRGKCARGGPCPRNRPHRCYVCGGNHRAANHHPEARAKANAKGDSSFLAKGGGKKGGGKGKKGNRGGGRGDGDSSQPGQPR